MKINKKITKMKETTKKNLKIDPSRTNGSLMEICSGIFGINYV